MNAKSDTLMEIFLWIIRICQPHDFDHKSNYKYLT